MHHLYSTTRGLLPYAGFARNPMSNDYWQLTNDNSGPTLSWLTLYMRSQIHRLSIVIIHSVSLPRRVTTTAAHEHARTVRASCSVTLDENARLDMNRRPAPTANARRTRAYPFLV